MKTEINTQIMPTDVYFRQVRAGTVFAYKKIDAPERPLGFKLKFMQIFDNAILVSKDPRKI